MPPSPHVPVSTRNPVFTLRGSQFVPFLCELQPQFLPRSTTVSRHGSSCPRRPGSCRWSTPAPNIGPLSAASFLFDFFLPSLVEFVPDPNRLSSPFSIYPSCLFLRISLVKNATPRSPLNFTFSRNMVRYFPMVFVCLSRL